MTTLAPAGKLARQTARQDPVQKLRGSNLEEEIAITIPCQKVSFSFSSPKTPHTHLCSVVHCTSSSGVVVSHIRLAFTLSSRSKVFVLSGKVVSSVRMTSNFASNVVERNSIAANGIQISFCLFVCKQKTPTQVLMFSLLLSWSGSSLFADNDFVVSCIDSNHLLGVVALEGLWHHIVDDGLVRHEASNVCHHLHKLARRSMQHELFHNRTQIFASRLLFVCKKTKKKRKKENKKENKKKHEKTNDFSQFFFLCVLFFFSLS